jgi:hypothetical protein
MKTAAFVALVSIACLAGCARTAKAPKEESAAAKTFEAPPGKGAVYLYRLGRAVGAATAIQVKINGMDAGGFGPGTFCRWELKPGKYTFHAKTAESSATVSLAVEAGKVYYIEQNLRIGLATGRVTMKTVSARTGQAGVKSKKLVVSAYVPAE